MSNKNSNKSNTLATSKEEKRKMKWMADVSDKRKVELIETGEFTDEEKLALLDLMIERGKAKLSRDHSKISISQPSGGTDWDVIQRLFNLK